MIPAKHRERTATGTEVTVTEPSVTRTLEESAQEAALVRSQILALRGEVEDLQGDADQVHVETILRSLEAETGRQARHDIASLLASLAELGFAWRDIARLAGVSVPAIHKWRRGGGSSPDKRWRIARILALCELLGRHPFYIEDVASWLEIPMAREMPVTPLDLLENDRIDLLLKWAAHPDARPEEILDELDPRWRERYESRFEVFTAPDGKPGIRFRQE